MTASFVVWIVVMVIMLAGLLLAARRSKRLDSETEDIASEALPEIGGIAEKKHQERFGRPPTGTPDVGKHSWYPAKRAAKHP